MTLKTKLVLAMVCLHVWQIDIKINREVLVQKFVAISQKYVKATELLMIRKKKV